MEAADLLCKSLFRWMKNRKECAEELGELAGAALSVLSKPPVVPGGMVPLLVTATGGAAICDTSPLVEAGISSCTFNKATKLIEEDEEVGMGIQKQLQDLKDRCGGTKLGAHADELECEVTTQLMCALARRDNTHVPLDFLRGFNRATFFRHMTPGGLDPAEASRLICQALNLDRVPEIKSILKVLDAIGLDRSLSNLIVNCEEIVRRKRVTEASKLLRDSARDILEGQQELKEQLNAMQEIIQKLFQMRNLIKDLGGYSLSLTGNGQKIMDYIMGTCTDDEVVSWLQELTNRIDFLNLLQFFLERLNHIFPDLSTPDGGHIDIVFVAHGRIINRFMPAGILVPTPNIRDTILYSPWNCRLNACAAFGIAQGFIQVTNRVFHNRNGNTVYCEPDPLPQRWNSMRGSRCDIPVILLSPLTPEEGAWALFHELWVNRGMEIEDRIIIPYLVPQNQVNAFGVVPLYIFIFVTSFILMLYGRTATVHLAACLGRKETPLMPEEWRTQYAYTNDGTEMTMNLDNRNMNPMLFEALTSMFDSQEP
ncbi:hypothetical protein DPX16_2198 [Anabarilius grahami]|uniref:Uncharacterized protein n=1 Tax=Anabarilius grahami TaxID=495550 RepID=A0A3N0Z502_ANAGA|nr:hypothetical protein DPX16_2198 [Anabarilius grahami]